MGNKIESLEHSSKNLKNNLMDLGIIPNISSKTKYIYLWKI